MGDQTSIILERTWTSSISEIMWENKVDLALMTFQYSLDQKVTETTVSFLCGENTFMLAPQTCSSMKSCGERERNLFQYHGFHMRRYFSLSDQKSHIDTGLLNIFVLNMYTSSWLCLDHHWCLLSLGIYFKKTAHCHKSQEKENTFSKCVCSSI